MLTLYAFDLPGGGSYMGRAHDLHTARFMAAKALLHEADMDGKVLDADLSAFMRGRGGAATTAVAEGLTNALSRTLLPLRGPHDLIGRLYLLSAVTPRHLSDSMAVGSVVKAYVGSPCRCLPLLDPADLM